LSTDPGRDRLLQTGGKPQQVRVSISGKAAARAAARTFTKSDQLNIHSGKSYMIRDANSLENLDE